MRILKKILIGSRNLLLFLFVSSLLAVVAYKFIPVYYTPLMFIRDVRTVPGRKALQTGTQMGADEARSPSHWHRRSWLRKTIFFSTITVSI